MWGTSSVQAVQNWNLCPSWSHSNLGPNNRPVCCFPRGLGICSADIGMVFSAGCQGQCQISRRNTILPHTTRTHSLHCLGVCLALYPFVRLSCYLLWERSVLSIFAPPPPPSHFDHAKMLVFNEPHDSDQRLFTGFASGHSLILDMKWQSRTLPK